MTPTRIEIDPNECMQVAAFIRDRAEEERVCASTLNGISGSAPSMPPGIAAVVTEAVCKANSMLGAQAAELDRHAEVLEIAARIIELDQAVAGAHWGLGVIDAAFAAVMTGAVGANANRVEALEALLASTDLTSLSINDWQDIAYFKAGIDPSEWDPERGLLELDDVVQAVYAYYGELYLDDPRFLWAAMANTVGPMFYAGWQDIYVVRHIADDGQRMKYLAELLGLPTAPAFFYDLQDHLPFEGPPEAILEHLTSEELEWFEHKFLEMQKDIFDDLAWQHEAYAHGGLPLIRQLLTEAGDIGGIKAWEEIDSGDPSRIEFGNSLLLDREQRQVIQPDYDEMHGHHGPVGHAFTYVTTWLAENPMPDGRSYRDFDGITIDPDPEVRLGPVEMPVIAPWIPRPDIEVRVPTGNIAYENDRMAWIEQDMFPRFLDLSRDPERMRSWIEEPFLDRTERFRRLDVLPYPR